MTTGANLRCGSDVRTHVQVRERSTRLASALAALGVEHGNRYAIVMRNEIGFVEATLAGAAKVVSTPRSSSESSRNAGSNTSEPFPRCSSGC
ncbi:AMP-binding protein [Rhodococcus koreensis]|uniref:AMP-binding protein n=1 Tax=Rhodococcus sp. T2V TaxID=3034164 RepID=UPI0023E1BEDB|nr:AMP-binding protein [Rhodococcus sp. T2V]MDF3308358.1 hypothetical protein [Rhodococcus sp. T2V]